MVLEGIKVLDAGSFVAGPAAATVMGDFGAEVIKIEPPEGDPYRTLHRLPGSPESDRDYYWTLDSRNKKSLALDLKRPEARPVLARLVRSADVFLTNMPLDVRARLGIRWPDLEPLNARLIYASVTAYGETGPEANKTGFDATAWWARTGLMDNARSSPGAAPARSVPGHGRPRDRDGPVRRDHAGALPARAHGQGRHGVHVPDGRRPLVQRDAGAGASGRRDRSGPARRGRRRSTRSRTCTDAATTAGSCSRSSPRSGSGRRSCAGSVAPTLADDPRFATLAARRAHVRDLVAELDAIFATRPWAEWRERLDAEGITFGGVREARRSCRRSPDARDRRAHAALDPDARAALTVE